MEPRTLHLLEFPKILRELSGFAVSEPGAAACLEVRPLASVPAVRRELALLDQALRWVRESGFRLVAFPDFGGFFPELDIAHRLLERTLSTEGGPSREQDATEPAGPVSAPGAEG